MLNSFSWLRSSRTGAELIATLRCLEAEPELLLTEREIGPPPSALRGPCQRCGVYAPSDAEAKYCSFCQAVIGRAIHLGVESRRAVVVWGYVNQIPQHIENTTTSSSEDVMDVYIHDEHRFLMVMHKRHLRPWLRDLALYHGDTLKGLLQLLPTVGTAGLMGMGDFLTRVIHYETTYRMDRLRVRFYPAIHNILKPNEREREGLLTFDVVEFLSMLEMAAVFRIMLRPDAQDALYELLSLSDAREESFYWGRFLGLLSQEAKDMLNAWRIRQWPYQRIKFLYHLRDYVYVDFSKTP